MIDHILRQYIHGIEKFIVMNAHTGFISCEIYNTEYSEFPRLRIVRLGVGVWQLEVM